MVDLLTVIPVWVTFGRDCPPLHTIETFDEGFIFVMFGLSTTRVLRALRIRRKLMNIEDAVDRCLAMICLSIGVMILFSKC